MIHVRQGWDRYEGAQEPKSAGGIRTVPIPEPLYEILDEKLLRLGRSERLIFGKTATEPFNYFSLRERTERAWSKAELRPSDLQLHEGRRSYSSFLSAAGVPDSRADRYMGHANHTVQGRYRHQLDPQYLDDAKTFTEYLRKADTPTRAGQVRDSEGQSVAV